MEQGVDALELDVVVTKDDVVVVAHDPVINPAICCGPQPGTPIRELALAQLREYDCGARSNPEFPAQLPVPGTRIPTLDEVFALGQGNSVQFNVEIKIFADYPDLTPAPDTFACIILDAIRRNDLKRRVMIQSFDARILRAVNRLDSSVPRGALFATERDWSEVVKEFEPTILGPEHHFVTPERVARAHGDGLQVAAWTANQPEDWKRLAAANLDAIIADDPAALIHWLAAERLR